MAQDEISEALLLEGQQALQQVDPSAYLVWPRIIRRLVLQDHELTGIGWHIPHRKSYNISRERLLKDVAPDELGVVQAQTIPENVILIARPDRDDLPELTASALQTYIWRLLLHSRVHRHFDELVARGKFAIAQVRERIDHIGQSEFDEIRAVLKRENFLFPEESEVHIYIEFVALYAELRQFTPTWCHSYFPSIHDFEALDAIVGEDVDIADLCRVTRLPAAIDPASTQRTHPSAQPAGRFQPVPPSNSLPPESRRAARILEAYVRRADKLAASGNSVRAAILRIQATPFASPDSQSILLQRADEEIFRLTARLQAALQFDADEAELWERSLILLTRKSLRGFWNNDARLLFDLQKVCIDHEREVSVVDLLGWMATFGRQPLKRALPNQREVLMQKHLRSALSRLPTTTLTHADRTILSELLNDAVESAEAQLRTRLRPLISEALDRVGLVPKNVPEKVARRKLIEELCDVVVTRGFLTIGNLRDAISQNNLKVEDLHTTRQVLQGDQVLRADRELSAVLDGVYNPGEFYMRWLQRLSSLAFGTQFGRFFTKFIAIPFGCSIVVLEGLDHLVHLFSGLFVHVSKAAGHPAVSAASESVHVAEPIGPSAVAADATSAVHDVAAAHEHAKFFMSTETFIGLGLFIMALIHVPPFRRGVAEVLRQAWRIIRISLYDTPIWFFKLPTVQRVLRSTPVVLFRRYLLLPFVMTAFVSVLMLEFHTSWKQWWITNGIVAFALCIVLNSRFGRDLEEVSSEYVLRLIHRIGVRFFLALFELIMDTFKRILESIERVLYAVDEWLRYKSGESDLTLIAKALLSVVWGIITFIVRFAVNILIEPQFNPIKHFPVVTVSHKLLITTFSKPLAMLLHHWGKLSLPYSITLAGVILFLIPGAVGFIVWELRSNWRLYVANRSKRLLPVIVGSHGETLIRLMRPGLHSGTLPKLFSKLRRAERKAHRKRWKNSKAVYLDRIHHVDESVHRFIERDFCNLLLESRGWGGMPVYPSHIETASNSLRVQIVCPSLAGEPLQISFEEQSGWLVAAITNSGWVSNLTRDQFTCLQLALAGLYKIGGVDLIREQITSRFSPRNLPFDISDAGLIVWPDRSYDVEVRYSLEERRLITPRPRRVAREYEMPDVDARALLYSLNPIAWRRWVEAWEAERDEMPIPLLFAERIHLLPSDGSTLL